MLEHISRDMLDVFLAAHSILQVCSQGLSRLTLSTPRKVHLQYPPRAPRRRLVIEKEEAVPMPSQAPSNGPRRASKQAIFKHLEGAFTTA